ncbi:hypothetical protein [Streptomyces sp. NPDC051569]|uniref:hypothetical protein n=1 Tax=Streptomyces sp. NPDC051569 TaxID=3365661 RepID=UPI0037A67AAE
MTSYLPNAARNFGLPDEVDHDHRYEIADEYLEVLHFRDLAGAGRVAVAPAHRPAAAVGVRRFRGSPDPAARHHPVIDEHVQCHQKIVRSIATPLSCRRRGGGDDGRSTVCPPLRRSGERAPRPTPQVAS